MTEQLCCATIQTITYLHQRKMYVVGGLIVGNPGNTRESIEVNLEFARPYADYSYIRRSLRSLMMGLGDERESRWRHSA